MAYGLTVTTGVWARGILATEYGVDLSKVTGAGRRGACQSITGIIPQRRLPGRGKSGTMVASGAGGAIGVGQWIPRMSNLIPNAREAEAAWYHKTGLYPNNHTVVVKDSLLQADPTLAPAVSRLQGGKGGCYSRAAQHRGRTLR